MFRNFWREIRTKFSRISAFLELDDSGKRNEVSFDRQKRMILNTPLIKKNVKKDAKTVRKKEKIKPIITKKFVCMF